MDTGSTSVVPEHLLAAEWLSQAKAAFNNGEFFRAFDLAHLGLREHPGDILLAHRAVLSLANSGAIEKATEKFRELGLDQVNTVEVLCLRGRMAKDLGYASLGAARAAAFAEAKSWYEQAQSLAQADGSADAYYPAINAASLALLAGDPVEAARLARHVLYTLEPRLVAAADRGHNGDDYWMLATAIEAHLLIGDTAGATALVAPALAASRDNQAELASTARQLERVLLARSLGREALARLTPPDVVHFLGHIIAPPGQLGRFVAEQQPDVAAAIQAALGGLRIGVAYGALAAGADIMLAEALLRRGAVLHVVLPFLREEFVTLSVAPAGADWVQRFDICMSRAASVRYATEDKHLGDDHLFAYGSQIAMGLAVLYARHLHARVRQIAVWDGRAGSAVAGTAVDLYAWQKAGLPQTIIPCGAPMTPQSLLPPEPVMAGRRHSRAMLFGDVCGFSQLTDEQLPRFAHCVMAPLGVVIGRYADRIDLVNTWGDGIFVVFADAGLAAACALEMQDAIKRVDLAAAGLPDSIQLRLGGHLGPVYELTDPILARRNFYGAHVSRAARIEPIVPAGCVYVTETFAAVLALSNADALACDYVGWTDMAKNYGRLRMFLLRHRHGSLEPAVLSDIERTPVAA